MNKIDDGGSAFPEAQRLFDNDTQSWVVMSKGGMSLRDWFAGQALIAIPHVGCGGDLDTNELAQAAYQVADAMLAARKEGRHDVA